MEATPLARRQEVPEMEVGDEIRKKPKLCSCTHVVAEKAASAFRRVRVRFADVRKVILVAAVHDYLKTPNGPHHVRVPYL